MSCWVDPQPQMCVVERDYGRRYAIDNNYGTLITFIVHSCGAGLKNIAVVHYVLHRPLMVRARQARQKARQRGKWIPNKYNTWANGWSRIDGVILVVEQVRKSVIHAVKRRVVSHHRSIGLRVVGSLKSLAEHINLCKTCSTIA